jgi:hypothetical protein
MDTGDLSPGVKRQGCEADHSPPSSAHVKNAWIYTSTPPYVFMVWRLIKHTDNFFFYFASHLGLGLPNSLFLSGKPEPPCLYFVCFVLEIAADFQEAPLGSREERDMENCVGRGGGDSNRALEQLCG